MRSFAAAAVAALAGREPIMRGMLAIDLPSGMYAFWDGSAPFTYQGITYQPGGQLLHVDPITNTEGLSAEGLTIRLNSIPNTDLTPDILATIEQEAYIGRPVTLARAYFSPDGALISVERIWRGYVDFLTHEDDPGGGTTALVGHIESKNLDNMKKGHRTRSPADQARVSAGDRGLEHVAIAGAQEIVWGRVAGK